MVQRTCVSIKNDYARKGYFKILFGPIGLLSSNFTNPLMLSTNSEISFNYIAI